MKNWLRFAASFALLTVIYAVPAHAQGTHTLTATFTRSADDTGTAPRGYTLYQAATCSGTFTKVNQTLVSGPPIVANMLPPGTYCVRATFTLNGAESLPSNSIATVILPAPPTNLTVAVDN